MSIASELNRLLQAKSDLATSIANKGVTVPAATTIDGYAALVDQIQTGGSLPYDAEIEYLQSTGTQYINTGILIDGTGTFSFGVKTTLTDRSFLGAIIGTRESPSGYTQYKSYNILNLSTTQIRADFLGKAAAGEGKINTTASALTIKFDTSVLTLLVNGSNISGSSTNQSCSYPFYLFAVNNGNMSNIPQKLEYFWFMKDNKITMYLIPVRVGQVGYMYDRVSGQMFGNAGTGNFTLGPDVT